MAGGFSAGSIMGMMSGMPVVKSGDVIINKLKAAKVMEAGDMGDVMSKSMGQGLQGLLQNAMKGKGDQAKSSINSAKGQIPTMGQGYTARAAIDNVLEPIVDALIQRSADMTGLGEDPLGLLNTVASISTLSTVAPFVPELSQDKLLKPLVVDDEFDLVSEVVEYVATQVALGAMTDEQGATLINEQASILQKILDASIVVSDAAETLAITISSMATAGALLHAGHPMFKAAMAKAIKPEYLPSVQAANEEFMRIEDPE